MSSGSSVLRSDIVDRNVGVNFYAQKLLSLIALVAGDTRISLKIIRSSGIIVLFDLTVFSSV